jgi:hypothetical protein
LQLWSYSLCTILLLQSESGAGTTHPGRFGKEMFGAYCPSCHGLDGKGNGPAAAALEIAADGPDSIGEKERRQYPSRLVVSAIKDGTSNTHGSKDMPIWGPILESVSPNGGPVVQQRLTNLTVYVESLQAK